MTYYVTTHEIITDPHEDLNMSENSPTNQSPVFTTAQPQHITDTVKFDLEGEDGESSIPVRVYFSFLNPTHYEKQEVIDSIEILSVRVWGKFEHNSDSQDWCHVPHEYAMTVFGNELIFQAEKCLIDNKYFD